MGRAPCCDKGKVKKGPWSPEEDTTLKTYLEKHGTSGNWIALPHKAGLNRCGKSCRLRWLNYLRPDIKHGGFTDDEDSLILTLHSNIGSRWSIIASQLPGRTDNDVKNYWNTKLKKKLFNHNTSTKSDKNINNNIIDNNDSEYRFSCLVPNVGVSDSNYNSLLPDIITDVGYGKNPNFGPNQEQTYFDQVGQLSSYNTNSSDHVEVSELATNTSSTSIQMSSTLSSSSTTLGIFDANSFATWTDIDNTSYGGVKSEDRGIFMECIGFDSYNDDVLLSDFGF